MKVICRVAIAIFLLASTSHAFTGPLDFPQCVQSADVIAFITVESDRTITRLILWDSPNKCRRIARAVVTRNLKGTEAGAHLELLHSNRLTCPNVRYTVGESYLVFLRKDGRGRYHTMNANMGRFPVRESIVERFHPSGASGAQDMTVRGASKFLTRLIEAAAKQTTATP